MAQFPPRSKSILRASKAAIASDDKARDKAKKNTVDSFVNFAHNLGIGADNAMTSSSYGFNPVTRNRTMLEWIHRGSWLGGVAVDVVADDMTRAGVEIKGQMKPEDISRLEEVAVDLAVWNTINDTIKWSRLYGGALAVILIDGQDPETPLRLSTIRKGQFRGLLSLDRWMVEPSMSDLVTDYGPALGLPKFYTVTANAPALSRMKIHHSRCIRLEGIRLSYWQRLMENLWGLSVLERLYDRMIAFDSASTGAAQLVYKSYLRTYKIKDLRDVIASGGDALNGLTQYVDMMRRFQGIEGITLLDAEDSFEGSSHGAFSGLSDALVQFGQQLSGALQIPLVRLFGQSPAGFSTGETDLRNYYDLIKSQQEKELRTGVAKVYRAMAASEGIAFPEGTRIDFCSLWQMNDTEKAQVASTVGDTISKAEEAGLIDRAVALKELRQSSHLTGIFTNITDEMISEAETEGPPIPEDVEVAEIRAEPQLEKEKEDTKLPAPAKDQQSVTAAGILFLTSQKQVFIMRRNDDADHGGTWGLPGGKIESKETPKMAAVRETLEETGYPYSGNLDILSNDGQFVTYVARLPGPFVVSIDPHEHSLYRWVEVNKLAGYVLHPQLDALLPLIEAL